MIIYRKINKYIVKKIKITIIEFFGLSFLSCPKFTSTLSIFNEAIVVCPYDIISITFEPFSLISLPLNPFYFNLFSFLTWASSLMISSGFGNKGIQIGVVFGLWLELLLLILTHVLIDIIRVSHLGIFISTSPSFYWCLHCLKVFIILSISQKQSFWISVILIFFIK